MNTLKLQHLLARRYSPQDMDRITFDNRIKSEHVFTSFDECLSYLSKVINKESIGVDTIKEINYDTEPNFIINIVDEAICSMIYEIYQQIYRGDTSNLGYYRRMLDDLYNYSINHLSKLPASEKRKYDFYEPLLMLIESIMYLCTPEQEREESIDSSGKMAWRYYLTMWALHKNVRPYSDYNRKLENYYYNKLS